MADTTIQLTEDEGAANDNLAIREDSISATAASFSAELRKMHTDLMKARQDFWRGLFAKYGLDPNRQASVQSGPGGAILVYEESLPEQADTAVKAHHNN